MAELPVRMPALSATMEDAELVSWLVEVGTEVRSGQPLAEVSTDKVDMELESPHDGTVLELLVSPGTRVDLGAVIATLTSEEEDLLGDLDLDGSGDPDGSMPSDQPDEPDPAAENGGSGDGPAADATSGRAIAAAPPPVRKRAKQLGVDLAQVPATGSRGHVTHADLTRYLESGDDDASEVDTAAPRAQAPAAGRALSPRPAVAAADATRHGDDQTADRRRAVRLATARTTVRSVAVPQFTLYRRLDLSLARERRSGRSWTTEIARALAAAIWRHPELNATWDDERGESVPLDGVRVGIAVDSPIGLVVVGIDDPDGVDPTEADRRIKAAVQRARDGKLTIDELQGVSSTISNLGTLGVDRFDALLVPPQPTILSVGRMVDTPVVVDGRVRVQPQIEVGLTVDHRVADGADGARLLETFARRLEG